MHAFLQAASGKSLQDEDDMILWLRDQKPVRLVEFEKNVERK